ncbi:hypothetical protein CGCF413_v009883 [Colletotrichum fructicola]|nr:hypothetical protein CGCF413_v009883 [Colletotrichum fructicola]
MRPPGLSAGIVWHLQRANIPLLLDLTCAFAHNINPVCHGSRAVAAAARFTPVPTITGICNGQTARSDLRR